MLKKSNTNIVGRRFLQKNIEKLFGDVPESPIQTSKTMPERKITHKPNNKPNNFLDLGINVENLIEKTKSNKVHRVVKNKNNQKPSWI